jgi:hypothetical protein
MTTHGNSALIHELNSISLLNHKLTSPEYNIKPTGFVEPKVCALRMKVLLSSAQKSLFIFLKRKSIKEAHILKIHHRTQDDPAKNSAKKCSQGHVHIVGRRN